MSKEKLMSVKECSKYTGISEITLINGLRQNKFPFGVAVESGKVKGRYKYIIYRHLVEEFFASNLHNDEEDNERKRVC